MLIRRDRAAGTGLNSSLNDRGITNKSSLDLVEVPHSGGSARSEWRIPDLHYPINSNEKIVAHWSSFHLYNLYIVHLYNSIGKHHVIPYTMRRVAMATQMTTDTISAGLAHFEPASCEPFQCSLCFDCF